MLPCCHAAGGTTHRACALVRAAICLACCGSLMHACTLNHACLMPRAPASSTLNAALSAQHHSTSLHCLQDPHIIRPMPWYKRPDGGGCSVWCQRSRAPVRPALHCAACCCSMACRCLTPCYPARARCSHRHIMRIKLRTLIYTTSLLQHNSSNNAYMAHVTPCQARRSLAQHAGAVIDSTVSAYHSVE
jgi:hypothetical protein